MLAYVPGEIEWSPSSLSFTTSPRAAVQQSVTFSCQSEVSVDVTSIAISGDARGAFSVPTAAFTVSGGSSSTLTVTYKPPAVGQDTATLAIGTDSSDSPTVDIALSGVASLDGGSGPSGGSNGSSGSGGSNRGTASGSASSSGSSRGSSGSSSGSTGASSTSTGPAPWACVFTGDGGFAPQTTYAAGTAPVSVAVGDFDGTGISDLAVLNMGVYFDAPSPGLDAGSVSVLLGTGTGTFGPQTTFPVGYHPFCIVTGDFDGDGVTDLAIANTGLNIASDDFPGDTVGVLLGTGTGSFGPQTTFAVEQGPISLATGDFNADGNLDLAVVDSMDPGERLSVLMGNGTGGFGPQTTFAAGYGEVAVAVGDFDGDGDLDLAVVDQYTLGADGIVPDGGGWVSVLMGTGTGSFGARTTFAVGMLPNSVAVGDFNEDGIPDLAVANWDDSTVSILLGTGTGSFGPQTTFVAGTGAVASVLVADFNGDGHLDLAVTDWAAASVGVLLGTGTGSFGAPLTFAVGRGPYGFAVGDFNGDGKPDLAVANATDDTVSILLNECGK